MDKNTQTQTIEELTDVVKAKLQAIGLNDDSAADYSAAVAEAIRHHFGGQQIYICKTDPSEIAKRNAAICAEYNGSNHGELCRKYNLSEQWLYKIVNEYRKTIQSDWTQS
jgi:Mor family transcriptional regulator